jgi:hypothetical protein
MLSNPSILMFKHHKESHFNIILLNFEFEFEFKANKVPYRRIEESCQLK